MIDFDEFTALMAHPLEGARDATLVEKRRAYVATRMRESNLSAERAAAVQCILDGVPPVAEGGGVAGVAAPTRREGNNVVADAKLAAEAYKLLSQYSRRK